MHYVYDKHQLPVCVFSNNYIPVLNSSTGLNVKKWKMTKGITTTIK